MAAAHHSGVRTDTIECLATIHQQCESLISRVHKQTGNWFIYPVVYAKKYYCVHKEPYSVTILKYISPARAVL